MSVTIATVRSKNDLEDFLRVPYAIYANDPDYVFPLLSEQRAFLNRDENPFYKHADFNLWLARQNGRVVGRVGACVDHYHNETHDEQTGFFGFFEAVDDPAVTTALLETGSGWISEQGMTNMRGPACFTTNHDFLGLLVDGEQSPPVVGMPYNPRYYLPQFEAFGLEKCKDLWAWRIEADDLQIPAKIQRIIDNLLQSDTFTVRPFNMDRFDEEASTVRELYNQCWSKNWGFIPMDDAEFAHAAKDMKKMVAADFLLVAESEGQPIGFCLTIPDFNQALKPCGGRLFPFGFLKFLWQKRKINYARCLLLGVLPEYRHRGVDVVMVYKTFRAGFDHGIHAGECSWILEDNKVMNTILAGLGAKVYKTYRIFDKPLS